MIKRTGFTKTDLAVALACVVFVLANVQIIIAGGREKAKREVCMANLRMLTAAWQMYADDNKGKIPPGDVYYSWSFFPDIGGPQLAWSEWPHPFPHPMPPSVASNYAAAYSLPHITEASGRHATAEGLLWKYIKDYDIYMCPVGDKNSYVTYSMSHSMNTWRSSQFGTAGPGSISRTISVKSQIKNPAERLVFLDAGFAKQGAFFVDYDRFLLGTWYDLPPMRHNKGTTFSFADGHSIYRKWTDPHTLESVNCGWGSCPGDHCDCDLRWIVKITWGDVPYVCTNPAKNCED